MRRAALSSVLALIVLAFASTAFGQSPPIEVEARSQVGHTATLCGTVTAYQCLGPTEGSVLALERPLGMGGVSIAIAAESRASFGPLFESRHARANVCATGAVERRKGEYVVIVTEPSQVQIASGGLERVDYVEGAMSACDAAVVKPTVIRSVKPRYPRDAVKKGIEGAVLLETTVLPSGDVGSIRTLRSLDQRYGLDKEAERALRGWRFTPGQFEGHAVPVIVTVEVSFTLRP